MLPVLAVIALVAFPLGLLASSPQFCGLYFAPVPKDPAYHYCDNPGFKAYKCHTNTCGDGEGDVTVQFKAFFSFPQEGYLDAYESSGKKYRCSTDNAHPHNQLRPRCGSCDPRIY
ncbi:hypothetical protein MJO29_016672 [Puccinia striiformis f. sp. tritici]|nr:hypothetical protein MJO29_016672 [Puccinia striiformis f. sp. tritici]